MTLPTSWATNDPYPASAQNLVNSTVNGLSTGKATKPVPMSELSATGTPSSATWLRGDGTWGTISGSVGNPPAFSAGITLGSGGSTPRQPVNTVMTIDANTAGTEHKIAHFFGTVLTGNFATGTGSDPTMGWGVNIFSTTGPAANACNGGRLSNLIEFNAQAVSGTITAVTGLMTEAGFVTAGTACHVTDMTSLRVGAPKRKDGATAGTVDGSAIGIYVENCDGTAFPTGAAANWAIFVAGGASQFASIRTTANAAPLDASLVPGELAWWFDKTTGAAKAMFKGKNASGNIVTGSVALT